MKNITTTILLILLPIVGASRDLSSITYRIASYNADAANFVIEAFGERPVGGNVHFINTFGATHGNRYNQIPRNHDAQLVLTGWQGCTIKSLTFSMCSNNKAGTVGFSVADSENEQYAMSPVAFNDDSWFGQWVSKDHGLYVDITKTVELQPLSSDICIITVKGGTQEGSVYLNSITIDYETPEGVVTESPLGWIYEKLDKKSTLAEGDVIMLYRSGDVAADINGMETSHYLDAIGISSTSNVTEPDIAQFTLSRDKSQSHWVLTDQHERQLCAKGTQNLAWNDDLNTWDINIGYNGAEITSTNSSYGTIRYNAPATSYPRFWNYTSTSLALPYAYRRVRQNEPMQSSAITLYANERTVEYGSQDTIVVKSTVLPKTTTDKRLVWTSSNESVASVNSGIVNIHAVGETVITATARDDGASAQTHIVITEPTGINHLGDTDKSKNDAKFTLDAKPVANHHSGLIITRNRKYIGR